jgi:hypothetical protein
MMMSNQDDDPIVMRIIPLVLAFAAGVALMDCARDMQTDDRVAASEALAAESADVADRAQRIAHHSIARASACYAELAEVRAGRNAVLMATGPSGGDHGR